MALEGRDNAGRGGASGRKESFGAGRGGAQREGAWLTGAWTWVGAWPRGRSLSRRRCRRCCCLLSGKGPGTRDQVRPMAVLPTLDLSLQAARPSPRRVSLSGRDLLASYSAFRPSDAPDPP